MLNQEIDKDLVAKLEFNAKKLAAFIYHSTIIFIWKYGNLIIGYPVWVG